MPTIALPAKLPDMQWRPTGKGQETTFVISGLLSVRIEITRTGWLIEGSHGRKLEGTSSSIGHAKQAAFTALKLALSNGAANVESALRIGG